MKNFFFFLLIISTLFLVPQLNYSQKKIVTDSLYEKLKKKDINKMTQREYEYFKLMKQGEEKPKVREKEQQGQISGVVTYFFNDNYGDKPDIGSKVFILPEKYKNKWSDVWKFYSEVRLRNLAEGMRKLGFDSRKTLLSDVEFDSLETSVSTFIEKLQHDRISETQKVFVDGNGSFSAMLKPGQYYLIARSAHRKSYSNKVELSGQIEVASCTVKAKQTTTVKFNFQARL